MRCSPVVGGAQAEQERDKALASRLEAEERLREVMAAQVARKAPGTPGAAKRGSKAGRAATDGDLDRPGHTITKPYSAASTAIR